MQTVFSIEHNTVQATRGDVLGVISMVLWSITLVVSMKYVSLVMRADNDGEGGILALVALLRRAPAGHPTTRCGDGDGRRSAPRSSTATP